MASQGVDLPPLGAGVAATVEAPASGSAHGAVTLDGSGAFQSVAPGSAGGYLRSNGSDYVRSPILVQDVALRAALTDAATIAVNAALGSIFDVTIAGSRTMGAPSNPTDGQRLVFRIKQGAGGSHLITWNAIYHFGVDVASPTLSTTAGLTDYAEFLYNAANTAWECILVARGL